MKIIHKVNEIQNISFQNRAEGKTVAVVPTMGFLHKGHLSLIRKASDIADVVITTLFVNPKQFAPNEDFDQYPKDMEKDSKLAKENGSDYLFAPSVNEMYPPGYATDVHVGKITEVFEGKFRPEHFDGVTTVVSKLFNATVPNKAVFGQKDYQQTLVVKRMVKDLNFNIDIVISPTVREPDGLAMSSRNSYLSTDERKKAGIIFRALEEAKREIEKGESRRKIINAIMQKKLREVLEIRIQYASSADANDLSTPDEFFPGEKIVLLVACHLGKTRLIDNMLIKIPERLNSSNFEKTE